MGRESVNGHKRSFFQDARRRFVSPVVLRRLWGAPAAAASGLEVPVPVSFSLSTTRCLVVYSFCVGALTIAYITENRLPSLPVVFLRLCVDPWGER